MIKPNTGRILVKQLRREGNVSGVILAQGAMQEETLRYGEVVRHDLPSEYSDKLEAGTKIFYSQYSATRIMSDEGDNLYLISDLDVMAIEE